MGNSNSGRQPKTWLEVYSGLKNRLKKQTNATNMYITMNTRGLLLDIMKVYEEKENFDVNIEIEILKGDAPSPLWECVHCSMEPSPRGEAVKHAKFMGHRVELIGDERRRIIT